MRKVGIIVVAVGTLVIAPSTSTPARAAVCPVPGNFVATITGVGGSGAHLARLAMYAFSGSCGGGSVQVRFWEWQGDATGRVYGNAARRVGSEINPDPAYPYDHDRKSQIQGLRTFVRGRSSLATRVGTWSTTTGQIHVTWSDGNTESWLHTWDDDPSDPRLSKLELVAASDMVGPFYVGGTGARERGAANTGFAFGAPGPDFTVARPLADAAGTDYEGLIRRNNAWCGAPASDNVVYETGLTMPVFRVTTTDTYRYVYPDGPTWVFVYVGAPKKNRGEVARRVLLQTSHDWDGDGKIAKELGHTYSGLQVIDAAGKLRGFVFADSSTAFDSCGENHTISSIYYLDRFDCDARYGVVPGDAGEC